MLHAMQRVIFRRYLGIRAVSTRGTRRWVHARPIPAKKITATGNRPVLTVTKDAVRHYRTTISLRVPPLTENNKPYNQLQLVPFSYMFYTRVVKEDSKWPTCVYSAFTSDTIPNVQKRLKSVEQSHSTNKTSLQTVPILQLSTGDPKTNQTNFEKLPKILQYELVRDLHSMEKQMKESNLKHTLNKNDEKETTNPQPDYNKPNTYSTLHDAIKNLPQEIQQMVTSTIQHLSTNDLFLGMDCIRMTSRWQTENGVVRQWELSIHGRARAADLQCCDPCKSELAKLIESHTLSQQLVESAEKSRLLLPSSVSLTSSMPEYNNQESIQPKKHFMRMVSPSQSQPKTWGSQPKRSFSTASSHKTVKSIREALDFFRIPDLLRVLSEEHKKVLTLETIYFPKPAIQTVRREILAILHPDATQQQSTPPYLNAYRKEDFELFSSAFDQLLQLEQLQNMTNVALLVHIPQTILSTHIHGVLKTLLDQRMETHRKTQRDLKQKRQREWFRRFIFVCCGFIGTGITWKHYDKYKHKQNLKLAAITFPEDVINNDVFVVSSILNDEYLSKEERLLWVNQMVQNNALLLWVAAKGHLDMYKLLVQHGADRFVEDGNNEGPLELAFRFERHDLFRYICENDHTMAESYAKQLWPIAKISDADLALIATIQQEVQTARQAAVMNDKEVVVRSVYDLWGKLNPDSVKEAKTKSIQNELLDLVTNYWSSSPRTVWYKDLSISKQFQEKLLHSNDHEKIILSALLDESVFLKNVKESSKWSRSYQSVYDLFLHLVMSVGSQPRHENVIDEVKRSMLVSFVNSTPSELWHRSEYFLRWCCCSKKTNHFNDIVDAVIKRKCSEREAFELLCRVYNSFGLKPFELYHKHNTGGNKMVEMILTMSERTQLQVLRHLEQIETKS